MNKLVTFKEAAATCRVTVRTIYKLVAAGDFPQPIAVSPHRRLFKSDELEDWLNNRPRGLGPSLIPSVQDLL